MFKTKKICALFFLAAFFLFAQQDAFPCSCSDKPIIIEEFETSKLVIATKLVAIEKATDAENEHAYKGVKSVKMVVEKVYKGNVKVGDELTFAQGNGVNCGWVFDKESIEGKYLFYLREPSKRASDYGEDDEPTQDALLMYQPSFCGRTNFLTEAAADLLYLDKINKLRGKTRISGMLSTREKDAPSFANLKIKIIGKNKTYEIKTNKNSVYELYDLPAGRYLIEPQILKGWKIEQFTRRYSYGDLNSYEEKELEPLNQISIVIEEKKHAELDFVFDINNHIRGKIFSPVGKPMKGVHIQVVSTDPADSDYQGQSARTDEKGEFEITSISPGNYILVVNGDGKMNADEPYGTLFYPGVAERKQAGVVSIELGKFLNNVNIQIPKTEELIEISGRFLYSDGKPVVNKSVEFKASDTPANIDGEVSTTTDEQGRFTIKMLKGIGGKLWGEMYTYIGAFENCLELEKIIKKTGEPDMMIKTDELEIEGSSDLTDVKLTFPFPSCAKAKD